MGMRVSGRFEGPFLYIDRYIQPARDRRCAPVPHVLFVEANVHVVIIAELLQEAEKKGDTYCQALVRVESCPGRQSITNKLFVGSRGKGVHERSRRFGADPRDCHYNTVATIVGGLHFTHGTFFVCCIL